MTGSFGRSKEALEAEIRQHQQAEAKASAPEDVESEVEDKVDEYLPKTVYSQSRNRQYSYEEFKSFYEDVWEAVASKDYLMRGSVTVTVPVGGTTFKLRSINAREVRGLSRWINQDGNDDGVTQGNDIELIVRELILRVEEQNGTAIKKGVKLSPETVDAWVEDPVVKQLYDFFMEKDADLVFLLNSAGRDLDLAKQLALTENLRRP